MSEELKQRVDAKPERGLRADARKNEHAILNAAKHVFAEVGVDAPVREIASRAGVGLATLYRRFPLRSDLIADVFRREIDGCTEAAADLAQRHSPLEALTLWLECYTAFMATKKGLSAALHSGDPAYSVLPDYFRSKFEPALTRLVNEAAASGKLRGDIDPYDLLRVIGNISAASGPDGAAHIRRMVNLLIDGLRYGATCANRD